MSGGLCECIASEWARMNVIWRPQLGASQRTGLLAFGAVLFFAGSASVLQGVRSDLDPLRATLSFYLLGPFGLWLRTAYWVLAAGLVALGLGYRQALARAPGTGLPAALFVFGGGALAAVTLFPTDPLHGERTLTGLAHNLCASAAFLCVGVAMLRLSNCMRRHARWRHRARMAMSMAVLAFTALWIDVFWRALPRGAAQKVVIALYLLWLGRAAWWLRWRDRYT
jgi:hypothetical protein